LETGVPWTALAIASPTKLVQQKQQRRQLLPQRMRRMLPQILQPPPAHEEPVFAAATTSLVVGAAVPRLPRRYWSRRCSDSSVLRARRFKRRKVWQRRFARGRAGR